MVLVQQQQQKNYHLVWPLNFQLQLVNWLFICVCSGSVFTFGLNDAHQLGHTTAPAQCLLPKMVRKSTLKRKISIWEAITKWSNSLFCWQIQFKAWRGKCMTGAAAGRYHTVLYNNTEVYTCGLNAGQLGRFSMTQNSKRLLVRWQP